MRRFAELEAALPFGDGCKSRAPLPDGHARKPKQVLAHARRRSAETRRASRALTRGLAVRGCACWLLHRGTPFLPSRSVRASCLFRCGALAASWPSLEPSALRRAGAGLQPALTHACRSSATLTGSATWRRDWPAAVWSDDGAAPREGAARTKAGAGHACHQRLAFFLDLSDALHASKLSNSYSRLIEYLPALVAIASTAILET